MMNECTGIDQVTQAGGGRQRERVTEHSISPPGRLRGLPLVWSPELRKRYTACAEGMKRG